MPSNEREVPYTPRQWAQGDLIEAEKLKALENAVGAIDNDIVGNGTKITSKINQVVQVSENQPIDELNKVWVRSEIDSISVPTEEEFEIVKAKVKDANETIFYEKAPVSQTFIWHQGTIDETTGVRESSPGVSNAINTTISLPMDSKITKMHIENGYKMKIFKYAVADQAYIECDSQFVTGYRNTEDLWNVKFAILVMKSDDSAILVSNPPTISYINGYGYTDNSLTTQGRAADAKAVGDSLNTVDGRLMILEQTSIPTLQSIATVQEDTVATRAYAVGEYFTLNNKLYKVTTAIAQNETIIPQAQGISNYNCTEIINGLSNEVQEAASVANTATNTANAATAAVTNISSSIATVETSTTASHAIAANSYFILDDVLYKATSDIAIGDPIVTTGADANCEEVPGGLGGQVADLKSTVSANAAELQKIEVLATDSTLTSWTQGKIYYPNGSTANSSKHCRKNAGLIKANTVLLFNGYNLNIFVYTSSAYSSAVYVKEMSTPNASPIVGADVGYRLDLTPYVGYYVKVVLSLANGNDLAPSAVSGVEIDSVAYTDTTLAKSGKSADAKTVGDKFGELTDAIGSEVVDSFTRTGSSNAIKTIAFPVTADVPIMFSWTSETGRGELNLYTRATYNGENLEQLKATAKPDTLYKVVPIQDAAYLRVSATASGTITAYDLSGLIGRMNVAENEIAILGQKAQNVPFVNFKFSDQMYDPSDIFGSSGEIGDINAWSSNALAISKVHAAFDALCASGGAGYGYGERVTGLYKESASDEALFDLTAPSYITQGVTQGETVVLNIGTDTSDQPVTYTYTYESSTQPYDIRLYKFCDTNNALHSNTTDIPKKKLLLIGGVHGNEFCAPIDLYVFAKHLCTDYTNPDVYKLRSSFDVYIIPYVNGFGCQYQWSNSGTMTTGARCNGHLVDINRNCPTLGWVGPTGTAEQITAHFESKIANLALDTFAGPSNGSEFEGQLVKAIIDWLSPDVVIDHHHNSGNSPFYATAYDTDAGYIIYQAANDFACALSKNLPEYYGTGYNINQILGSDVSPATRAAANGHINTMAYECGVKMSAVNEMAQSIAYNNGVYDAETKAATKYSAVVFKVSEYSLLIEMLRLCQYAMEH